MGSLICPKEPSGSGQIGVPTEPLVTGCQPMRLILASSPPVQPPTPGAKGHLPGKPPSVYRWVPSTPPHRLQSPSGVFLRKTIHSTSLGRVESGCLWGLLCGAQVNATSLFARVVPAWRPCASLGYGQGRDGAEVPAADHGVPGVAASLCLAAGTSRRDPGCRARS